MRSMLIAAQKTSLRVIDGLGRGLHLTQVRAQRVFGETRVHRRGEFGDLRGRMLADTLQHIRTIRDG